MPRRERPVDGLFDRLARLRPRAADHNEMQVAVAASAKRPSSPAVARPCSYRAINVIESGGEWISSIELENVAAGHPKVQQAAVIGAPDSKWDERPLVAKQL